VQIKVFRPKRRLAALLLSTVSFAAVPAVAEHIRPPAPELPCGKARAMAGHVGDCEPAPPNIDGSLREAMDETDVLHYALDIEVSNLNTAANNCTINGTNAITIRSKSAALTQFTFRLHSNYAIGSLTVTDGPNTFPVSASQTSSTTRVVTLNRTYGLDEEFILTIGYSGTSISIDNSIDVDTQGGTPVVATLTEPFGEYTWWPCKDGDVGQQGDNSDKATLQFDITVPNNFIVPSNGIEVAPAESLSGNRKRYHWATAYQIPTYLVSFAATNYNTWTQTYNFPAGPYNPAGSMPVQFFIYPANDNAGNRAAWSNCLNMLATYRTIYGEYPFVSEKYGIYNFNYGGGMEHQTITGQGTFSESVTAHELGHQWWGDNVTCKLWGDIWLNEGFATYTECLWEERKAGGINTTAYFNALNSRRPSSNGFNGSVWRYDVSTFGSIFSYTYSYAKGAWVLHMLRHVVGDSAFFAILDAYRQQFTGSAATTNEFAAIASAVSGKNLTPFFEQWVFQRGAPTYQFGWQSVNVGGQNYLLVRVNQTQTETTGTPHVMNVYEMPVDLRATIGGNPQVFVIQNDARTEWFVIPVPGTVTALNFDNNHLDATSPRPYILRGSATSVAYQPGPPKVVAVGPAPGEVILQPSSPSQFTVTFHTPVNCVQADFSLVGAMTGAQSLSLVSGANVNPAVLNLPGPLAPDTYALTVTTGVTAANSGLQLDGEIANPTSPASLPSGDGVTGGNAMIQFTVQACNAVADIDANCVRDELDVDLFVQVLLGLDTDPGHMARSDVNNSFAADGDDVGPFTSAYLAP
jgi:hypothetical protein